MSTVYELKSTKTFNKWLQKLKNPQARKAITFRLLRAEAGHLGDVKPISQSIHEMRIFIGKGYRIYFTIRNNRLIFLLCGGDKSSQKRDIENAKQILRQLENEE